MAPEQASGESDKIDRRTDIYAFGAVLYEMLTGRTPFVGGTLEILGQTLGEVPQRPSELLRSARKPVPPEEPPVREAFRIPPPLEELCMKCLKKAQAERPPSMDEVLVALEGSYSFGVAPAPAVPPAPPLPPAPPVHPGPPERSRRPRALAVVIALSAVILAGGSALVHFLLPGLDARPAFEEREQEVLDAIRRFQSDRARSLSLRLWEETKGTALEVRASRLAEESQWVARLQTRVTERLVSRPVDLPALPAGPDSPGGLRLLAADADGLHVLRGGRPDRLAWERLEPATRVELLGLALGEPDEADLLGLAIFALRNGRSEEAGRLFSRLRATALAPLAERYLGSSNN
jgi:hypothetical protein